MKIIGAIALSSLFLLPNVAWAACIASGATVVYVNGIFTTETQARRDAKNLSIEFSRVIGDSSVKFINGYNPSHLAGLGDLAQTVGQMMGKSISNFDRDTILLQIHPQVTTRKLVLVGHSQGAFYANALYDYLLAHGEPKAAVGAYQVASPAAYVAGGGRYLNSSADTMLDALRGLGFTFLVSNIDLAVSPEDAQKKYPGHSFSGAYLAEAPERVVGDIQKTLAGLTAEQAGSGECFTAPEAGLGYNAAKAGFAVADTAAGVAKTGLVGAQKVGTAVRDTLLAAAAGAFGLGKKVAADVGVTVGGLTNLSHAATDEVRPTNFDIFEKLYGSSLTKDDVKELLGQQGSAVATADAVSAPGSIGLPQAGPEPEAASPAPKKITYLSGGHSHRDSDDDDESEIETEEPPSPSETTEGQVEPEPEPEPESEPEPEVPPTPPSPTEAPLGSPVWDSFDAFNTKGWQTPETNYNVLIPFEPETDTAQCHSGGCIVGLGHLGGLGTPSQQPFNYLVGEPALEGAAVVWAKMHTGWRKPMVSVGACVAGTSNCSVNIPFVNSDQPSDDVWHQYYFAWRQGATALETCTLSDTIDPLACGWHETEHAVGTAVDGILLYGTTLRADLGDRIWFDDLEAVQ